MIWIVRGQSVVDHSRDEDRRVRVVRDAFVQKRAFQREVIKVAPIRRGAYAVETHAGNGRSPVAKIAGLKHLAIEANRATAKLYKRRNPKALVLASTWQSALQTHARTLRQADIAVLDVDPFGRPFAAVSGLLKANQPSKPMLALVTYGYLFEQVNQKFNRAKAWQVLKSEVAKACRSVKCVMRPIGFAVPERFGVRATSKVIYGAFSVKGKADRSDHLPKLASGDTPFKVEVKKQDLLDWLI